MTSSGSCMYHPFIVECTEDWPVRDYYRPRKISKVSFVDLLYFLVHSHTTHNSTAMSSIASSSRSVLRASVPRAIASCPAQCVRPSMVVGAAAAAARATRSTIAHPNYSRSFFSLTDISKLAGTLTGASPAGESEGEGERSGIESDGETQKFHARKILPYSQAQLYSLVSDVPSYSSFIPFCTSSRVLSGSPSGSVGGGAGASAGASAGAVAGDGAMNDKERGTRDWKPDDQPFDLDAELTVGFGGLEERYTSRVVGRPFESVTVSCCLCRVLKTVYLQSAGWTAG